MKLPNYLPKMAEIDRKGQLKIEVKSNPLREIWIKVTQENPAEELKKRLKEEHNLNVTTRSIENYIYGNSFPLKIIRVFEKFDKDIWDKVYSEMQEVCYRNTEGGKTQWIKLPKTLTKELAYIAGALRDGYINLKINRITVAQKTCEKWLSETIIPMFQKSFNVNSIKIKEGKMVLYSAPISLFLAAVFEYPQGKQTCWPSPQIIIEADKELQASYFQGYFDAEGNIDTKKAIIKVSQVWHENKITPSIIHLRNILEIYSIKSNIDGPRKESKGKSFMSQVYIFCKRNRKNFILFKKFIYTKHPTKIKKLDELTRLLCP